MIKVSLALVAIYLGEWVAKFYLSADSFWYLAICSKQLSLALCLSCCFNFCSTIRIKSLFAFLCISAWVDFVLYIVWVYYGLEISTIIPAAIIFFLWAQFIFLRSYNIESDEINHKNIMILMLRPEGFFMVVKSLFGVPVSSICIMSGGYVYSFRTDTNKFTRTKYTDKWLVRHVCVDTGVSTSPDIESSLATMIGAKRGIGIKCVYILRDVLSKLGEKWKPKTIFNYLPGLYAMQVLGGRNESESW